MPSTLFVVEDAAGNATFSTLEMGETMVGQVAVPLPVRAGVFLPPATYSFPSSSYHGELSGGGGPVTTAGTARPLEFSFFDNLELDSDALDLLSSCLGLSLPPGTRVDLAEIESDRTVGSRRVEIGFSRQSVTGNLLAANR
jgi:hypothetical protein